MTTTEYVIYTDLLIEGYSSAAAESYLTSTTLLPFSLNIDGSRTVDIVQINVTRECNTTDTAKSCACKEGYKWNLTVCYSYATCNDSSFCSCILVLDDNIPFCEQIRNVSEQTGVSTIEPRGLQVKFWDPVQLTCQINGTMTAVNWTLVANNSTNMIFSSGGNVDVSTQFLSNKAISILTIKKADRWWNGTYVCQFSNNNLTYEARAEVIITLLPSEIIMNPVQKSLSANDTSPLALECCVQFDGEVYNVTWRYNKNIVSVLPGRRTDLQCYNLSPPRPATDTNYTCTFTNKAGQKKENFIPVTVIQVTDMFCNTSVYNGVTWNVAKAGIQAIASCPSGKSGNLTRDCSADGQWMTVQDNCISQALQMALDNAQTLGEGLGNLEVMVPEVVQQLSSREVTVISNTAEVAALVSVLGTISTISANENKTFDTNVVTNFLMVASNLTDPSYSSLWQQPNSPGASEVLRSVEQFSLLLQEDNNTFEIELQNIHLKGTSYEKGSNIDNYEKTFDITLGVSTYIDKNIIYSMIEKNDITISSLVFMTIGNLLPTNAGKFNGSQLNSIVQSNSIRISGSGSFSGDVFMTFGINISDEKYAQHCVFWDFSQSNPGWSDYGCRTKVGSNSTNCTCNHLTSFAVLMSVKVESLFLIEEITYAGLGVSILSLCICVIVEGMVWKQVVRTNISYFRHISLVNIALSLLCADTFFLSSAFPSVKTHKYICLSITFLNHFFYLSLFFWTFCQSVMLLHQLLFVFHHLRKRLYISLSFFVGYFFPAAIATGTFLYFDPKETYTHRDVCWLNPESGAIYTFAIPAGAIILFNFMTLLVVISKLTRSSVSDAKGTDDRDTAKSIMKAILVLTPVFGLTWAFGFALLKDLDDLTRQIFTYGFAGMNAFQGFFILLTCVTEKKVREALSSKQSSSVISTATTMSTSETPNKISTASPIKNVK
ncbi:adhesion G-protein coupled receptor F3-like [Rhinophrynus dorsalis]